MKKYTLFFSILTVLMSFTKLHAQSQEDMKAYMEYMTPGSKQQMMAKSAGNWTGVVTMWQKEGAQPTTSTMDAVNEMILGGRYLKGTYKGMMYGMPFEGIGTTGYDNAKKVFMSSWIDNMGTGIMNLEGNWDSVTNTLVLRGNTTDPLTGKDMPIREVLKFNDDNHQQLEMYFMENGKEFKGMEIKSTRK